MDKLAQPSMLLEQYCIGKDENFRSTWRWLCAHVMSQICTLKRLRCWAIIMETSI